MTHGAWPRYGSAVFIAAVALATPATAFAHPGDDAGGLATGFAHPLSGLDHVLAMIAVGLWGAQLGRPAVWLLPVAFPMMMAVGGFVGLIGVHLPGVEIGIALSACVLGAMVLLEARPDLRIAAMLVGVFAIFHGHAHGTELPPGDGGLLYSIGFVTGTGFLHAVGIGIGLIHAWPIGRVTLRLSGLAVTLAGLLFMTRVLW